MRHLLFIVIIFCTYFVTSAQNDPAPPQDDIRNHPVDVFLERSVDATGIDRLIFVDSLTGEETTLEVYGQQYTPLPGSILFYDQASGRVMQAYANGTLAEHPFIQPNIETRYVDWVINGDKSMIAWTLTNADETGQLLTTVTIVAGIDGSNARQVLIDGPYSDSVHLLPVAFSADNSTLYMDQHFEGLNDGIPIIQYVSLLSVNIETSEITYLPGEDTQTCLCGADVNAGFFIRPVLNTTTFLYDMTVYDLTADVNHLIDGVPLQNYIHVSDIVISPDGRYAVYALRQINALNTAPSTRTVFVLIDLSTMTQEILTQPLTRLLLPVAWTEDNSAIIFTSPNSNGTWKVELSDGRLDQIAEAAYLGTLRALNAETLASG